MRRRGCCLVILLGLLVASCMCVVVIGSYWASGPVLSCARPAHGPAQPGWSTRTLVSGGLERCYVLYMPTTGQDTGAMPLVVSLHGFLSNPNSQAAISGWHKLAEREGFLVVYPQGTSFPQRWNAFGRWGSGAVDDVQFFRDLLDDVATVAPVDLARVYVNGLSNGGGMSVRIGCEAADRVAAIGSVAGAIASLETCNPARPVPLMAFHGTADPLVRYEGGVEGGHWLRRVVQRAPVPLALMGAEEWVGLWAQRDQCDPTPQPMAPHGSVRGMRYVGCAQGAEVILYTVEGGGHTWPGGTPIWVVGKTSTDMDATQELWSFFARYSLGSAGLPENVGSAREGSQTQAFRLVGTASR